jgi:RNA polymerase-associated protein CTR9
VGTKVIPYVASREHQRAPATVHDMATLTNGHVNGHTHLFQHPGLSSNQRFSDIPSAIDIPVSGADIEEAVEVDLEGLLDDPTELCTLLENENAAKNFWMVISLAYAKQGKMDHAIEILNKGLVSLSRGPQKEKIGLLSLLCWLYLYKSREAPRVVPEGELVSEARTKDYYLQAATGTLNEASRVNPSFPPLFLARGILSLLRASLQPPSKAPAPGAVEQSERVETLRQALKCFDDASRVSTGRNMMALMGKARTLFSLGRYTDALDCYQEVLAKMPEMQDPDPRIGIGCCLWQLSHQNEAREAWERALEIVSASELLSHHLELTFGPEPQLENCEYPSRLVLCPR